MRTKNHWLENEIRGVGSSYDDILSFPDDPRKNAGFQLGKVQSGLEPEDWKKTEATTKRDKDIAEVRYRAVVRERKDKQ